MLDAMTGYETENGVPSDRLIWHQRFLTFFAGGAAAKNPEEVPFEDRHWTPFQAVVYRVLRDNVRWGETISYGELASLAGFPGAARAVGHAMARNTGGPFVPCHRVIAARGAIGGYSGTGGVRLKRALLAYERKQPLIRSEGPEHPLDHHPGNSIPSRRS
ncbi:MGMT family protein [bacterium]|nr:MGMT family protein [candidate division CSSED10-310 bacterium]